MKKTLIVLILANIAFFVAMQLNERANTERAKKELPPLNEKQIRLLNLAEVEEAKGLREKEQAKIAKKPEIEVLGAPTTENRTVAEDTPNQEPQECAEWGEFSGPELTHAKAAVAEMKLGDKVSEREVEYETSYWVYMRPLKNKKAVNKKIREIKKLGIEEYFVVGSTEKWANAISLGVFKTQEAAEKHLAHLKTKGIRTAIVGERGTKLKAIWFEFKGINQEIKTNLQAKQQEFTDSELKMSSCALTK